MDAATQWLLEHDKAPEMSTRQYAKSIGILMAQQDRDIRSRESLTSEVHDVKPHCRQCGKHENACE